MKPAAVIQTSIDLLQGILDGNQPADHMTRQYFKERRFIGSKDRKAISAYVFHILRFRLSLEWWVEKCFPVSARLLLLTHLMLDKEQTVVQLSDIFSGDLYAPETFSQAERKYLENLQGCSRIDATMPFYVRYDIPAWTEHYLRAALGEKIEEELGAMLQNAPLDVRINPLKSTTDEAEVFFRAHNISFERLKGAAYAYRLPRGIGLSESDYFQSGCLEVQDLGSQQVMKMCNVQPGMQVLDYCAGAGGKTLGLAAQMENKGNIIACDISDVRLKQAKVRLKRAGVQNTQVRLLDAQTKQWLKRQKERFDRILLDVPCSGSGTWRRNPDLKWRVSEENLTALRQTQQEILEKTASLVKPGGQIIYVTCSLFPQENEHQIQNFLEKHEHFSLVSEQRLTPFVNGTDGFYCAVLNRIST